MMDMVLLHPLVLDLPLAEQMFFCLIDRRRDFVKFNQVDYTAGVKAGNGKPGFFPPGIAGPVSSVRHSSSRKAGGAAPGQDSLRSTFSESVPPFGRRFAGRKVSFCGDKQVASGNAAFRDSLPCGFLIAIGPRCVDLATGCLECLQNAAFTLRLAHQKRPKNQNRQFNTMLFIRVFFHLQGNPACMTIIAASSCGSEPAGYYFFQFLEARYDAYG